MNYKDIEKELREKYRKSYNGILSNKIIEKGIDFHLSFLKAKINQVIDNMIREVEKNEKLFNRDNNKKVAEYIVQELKDYKKKFNKKSLIKFEPRFKVLKRKGHIIKKVKLEEISLKK